MGDLRGELLANIRRNIDRQPRTLQTAIGPSEIGNTCSRAILHRLAGTPDPDRGDMWRATVGTAVHAQLETWFAKRDGYLTELRVTIGNHAGQTIKGTTDLYHIPTGTVIDWKTASATKIRQYRTSGPTEQQITQIHLYGLGIYKTLTTAPTTVALAYLPRDGLLTDLHIHSERWQPQVALDALTRLETIYDQLTRHGLETALTMYTECGQHFCPWCKPAPPTTLAQALATANR